MTPRDGDAAEAPAQGGILKLAVLAVGGQGGGVLTGWIEDLGRQNGHAVQATSVAGVAQRTGATVYYVEMAPASARLPVFALMPAAGDVDVLIAAEWMEAGRAILRGFVTPDRTTLIASTHRALAVSEKMVPGSGIADAAEVLAGAEIAARRLIGADFDAIARREGSVISAALFGALAASGTLPFSRAAFEAAVRAGGKGVEGSLRAFAAGYEAALGTAAAAEPAPPAAPKVRGPARLLAGWQALAKRIGSLPEPSRQMAQAGLQKVVGFQDLAYGGQYLDRLDQVAAIDRAPFALSLEAAKHLANAMAYDDIIAVADAKTKAGRRARIAAEMGAGADQVMRLTEFLHPRAEEIVSMLPARMGARWAANPRRMAWLDRAFGKPRRLRSDGLGSFVLLYLLAGLRFWRPRSYRHAVETAHLARWLDRAMALSKADYALGVEVLRCRRLVKGYSDTHARGLSKFDRVIGAVDALAGREDAADWARRLREAALKDETGKALDGALATVRSFLD
ncbi:MAG: indolepyruvate oxidoreductase subunit beta family protein [Paracoccaceae bacterium]